MSFGKTQKLHRTIDHRLAGVARQAHFALDGATKEDTAVQSGHGDDGENKEVNKNIREDTGRKGRGGVGWGGVEADGGGDCPEGRSDDMLVEMRLVLPKESDRI